MGNETKRDYFMKCKNCGKDKILRSKKWLCRDCQILSQKRHYQNNREREIAKRRIRAEAIKEQQYSLLIGIKTIPCLDCGGLFPHYVMEFDHTRGNKINAISKMIGSRWDKILEEIKKCDIVCANCHRQRTWNRNHAGVV